jgi:hypothetical protein
MKLRGIALAAVALMAPALNGCSGGSNTGRTAESASAPGQIDLQLRLPDGSTLDTVGYEITHSNGFDRDGTVNVANSTLVRFQFGNIPAAVGYNIALSGTTSAGVTCSSEPRSFDVQAGVTTGITVTLRCGAGGTTVVGADAGNVRVNVDVQQGISVTCPALDGLTALPLEVIVGNAISLVGYGTTSTATFAWTVASAGGAFSAASEASTTFTPSAVGDHVVTLTLGGPTGCPTFTETVTVTASPAPGDDASVPDASVPPPDASEPPDTSVPPPDASEPPDASVPPDASEPPDASAPPDASEPPDTSVPPDASEPPDTGVPPPDTGVPPGPTCESCQNTACRDFQGVDLVAGCFTAVVGDFGADPSDPNFIQDCTDTVQCARTNGCGFTAQFQAAECYCGTNSGDACTTTGPAANAPCLAQWQRATRTTVNADVLNRFSDLAYPSGWAYFLMDCYRTSCNAAASGNCTVVGP